ncbi:MAG: hypothetical protein J7527_15795 [Chitinophagaceae bacterium]|nr:hypothetical protein [Chitinophagaceae bacterium]
MENDNYSEENKPANVIGAFMLGLLAASVVAVTLSWPLGFIMLGFHEDDASVKDPIFFSLVGCWTFATAFTFGRVSSKVANRNEWSLLVTIFVVCCLLVIPVLIEDSFHSYSVTLSAVFIFSAASGLFVGHKIAMHKKRKAIQAEN